jgi:hypothetical protein
MKLIVEIETSNNPLNHDLLEGSILLTCGEQKLKGDYFFNYHPVNLFEEGVAMDIDFIFGQDADQFEIDCHGKYPNVLKSMSLRNNLIWSCIVHVLDQNIRKINGINDPCKIVINTVQSHIELSQYLIMFGLSISYGGS